MQSGVNPQRKPKSNTVQFRRFYKLCFDSLLNILILTQLPQYQRRKCISETKSEKKKRTKSTAFINHFLCQLCVLNPFSEIHSLLLFFLSKKNVQQNRNIKVRSKEHKNSFPVAILKTNEEVEEKSKNLSTVAEEKKAGTHRTFIFVLFFLLFEYV